MTRRICSSLVALLIFSLICPVWAATDPEALQFVRQLHQAMEDDDRSGFRQAVSQNPQLARRAFVSAIEYGIDHFEKNAKSEAEMGFKVAGALSVIIKKELGDSEPANILATLRSDKKRFKSLILAYANSLYPGYEQSFSRLTGDSDTDTESLPKYTDLYRSSGMSEQTKELITPYMIKLLRISLASAFSDPSLLIQELDTYPIVERTLLKELEAAGAVADDELNEQLSLVRDRVKVARLTVLAETGLLSEIDDELSSLMERDEDINTRLALFYTGFRVALRQQDFDQATSYLNTIERELKDDQGFASPAFPFVLATGRLQIEVEKGAQPEPKELLLRFAQTWNLLSSFEAVEIPQHDISWYVANRGARFWVEQLALLTPAENVNPILRITDDCGRWVGGMSKFGDSLSGMEDLDVFLNPEKFEGYLTVGLGSLDVLVYIIEKWEPMKANKKVFGPLVDSFPKSVDKIANASEKLDLNLDLPGFPPYDLSQSALVNDLRARIKYLSSVDPVKSKEQRLGLLQEASRLFEKVDLPESFLGFQLDAGRDYLQYGRPDLALEAWGRAYKLAQDRGFVKIALHASTLLAEEYGRQGDWKNASIYANNASQSIREEIALADADSHREMMAMNASVSQLRVRAAINSEDPETALKVLNEGHQVQSAALQISSNKEASKAANELGEKRKKVAALTQKVQALKSIPESTTRDELIQKTEKLLAEKRSEFLLESRKIRDKFSQLYRSALRFDPLNLADIQSALPAKTAVVQYFPTDQELFFFVVTNERFRLRSKIVSRDSLNRSVANYVRQVRRRGRKTRENLSQELYSLLVEPISQDLAGSDTVVLIPTGALNTLPFASLQKPDGSFLVEEKTILELAKPTDFMKIAFSKPQKISKVVSFANATLNLPAAEEEGKNITSLYPGARLFSREDASRENFLKFGTKADALHLATHGTTDPNSALNNHLELSNQDKLAQEEIFELPFDNTALVTLSACDTAVDNDGVGEGMYVASLAEAFWIAGSKTVVASLWQVEDVSTGLLMTRFYEELKIGTPKALALKKAQLFVKSKPEYSHPYYWSGFLLFGDYR